MLPRTSKHNNYFVLGVIGLCALYLLFEFFLNSYATMSVDDFWYTHSIYQYKDNLPYRDFAPYKTVLGYYLLLLPMLFSHGIFETLIFIKNAMAILNACVLFASAFWLARFFQRSAILLSLSLVVSAEFVLFHSTNIRVDLLGYWFCLFSLLLLLENRYTLAGFLLGLGFITTQKTLWYIAAGDGALLVYWLFISRNLSMIWNIARFNLMIAVVIVAYIAFWSWLADWKTIIHSMFYEASAMYHLNWYDGTRALFWSYIILYNPLVFLLWPLTWINILVTYDNDPHYSKRLIITTYSIIILLCLIPYKQVFPYYMQIAIPLFFVLYSAFFTWMLTIFRTASTLKIVGGKKILWLFLTLYVALIIFISVSFNLPNLYLLICLIPLLLGTYITNKDRFGHESLLFSSLIAISMIFVGGVYSLTLFTIKVFNVDGTYQKANVSAVNALLEDGSDYVAGIDFIYNKNQPIPGMRHLMGPAIEYLSSPTDQLRAVMLPSLYEDPNATVATVIEGFKHSTVKFYVNNYRMNALPAQIKNYLDSEYEHYWGSIYLYAPTIKGGEHNINIKFSGNYRIESQLSNQIELNHKIHAINSIIHLSKKTYLSYSKASYRLKLIPQPENFIFDPKFQQDESHKVSSVIVL